MYRYFLSIRGFYALAVALSALLLAAGCGSSGSSATDAEGSEGSSEVTVQTGSLSKAEFIERADAICESNRSQFSRSFEAFNREHPVGESPASKLSWLNEVVDTVLMPIYEKQVDQLSSLGAPSGDEAQMAAFVNALQRQLDAIRDNPTLFAKTITPFKAAEGKARQYGLTGCAENLS